MQTIFNPDWSIVPEKNGVPLVKWSEYMTRKPKPGELTFPDGCDYGLICGEVSDVLGLDIDIDEEEAKIMALIDGSSDMLAKRGSKGRTIFFKYNGEVSKSWKKDGKVVCELLSDKRKCTIPPSKHRTTGKPYEWINEDAVLVTLPDNVITVMNALYPSKTDSKRQWSTITEFDRVELPEVENMLSHVSADCSRDEWLAVGMALRDEFGDAAYSIWDNWSSSSAKYKPREIPLIWRSFNGDGIGIGTLVWMAQEAGYIKTVEIEPIEWEIDLSYLDVKERKELVAHGLVGDIAQWITETATRPQPQLSLGAALAFVGMLKGHKFETVTNLRTNFLAMNIAPSGAGKDDPLKAIDLLAEEVGLDIHLLSEPTAGTSLLRGLLDAKRVGLWSIDEFGRYLAHVTSKNAGNYQKEVIDYVIKMFGRASGTLRGKKFANEKLNPQINIKNPHLCVIGTSVKEHIVDNCTTKNAIDGFLNRWILFESKERPRMKIGKKRVEVPQNVKQQIQRIIDSDPNGMYELAEDEAPTVKQVRYTPEAWAMVQDYQEEVEDIIDRSPPLLQALYTRTYEHTTKIALILCDDEFIRVEDLELAIEIVSESNKLIADLAGLIGDNEQEKMVIKALEVIKVGQPIAHREFVRRTRSFKARDRKEILNDLVQSGEIIAEESGKTYIYHCA